MENLWKYRGELFWGLVATFFALGWVNEVEMIKNISMVFFGLLVLCYALSFYEYGPFTQLPNGRYLAIKRGMNVIRYVLNQVGWGVAEDDMTFVPDPEGKYQEYLESGILGFFYKYMGMVWTGIPVIGGVKGSIGYEKVIRFTQKENGTLEYRTEDIGPTYYTAPPFLRKYGFILGSIPSEGNNGWNFAIPARIRITNPNDYDHRLVHDPNGPVKGSFESSLRPLIKKKSTKDVLELKSENKDDQNSVAFIAKQEANANMRAESLGGYGYGVELHDVDFQVIEPSDPEFAKAIRMDEIANEVGKAKVKEAKREGQALLAKNEAEVKIIETQGRAKAEAAKQLFDAVQGKDMALFADAIKDGNITTLVIGNGTGTVLPLNSNDPRQAKPRDNARRP